ncbi:AraC family transcriptional regulator [Vibrio sp. JC009]|uniref:AraC family transcriptional regulator n=1 Tax=Vibrio sp. JC009 TaxID=2912314 RepID=UPI0023AFAFA3|nr:AraC family transcriptional regulator [Vibrio sp. JC009]WED21281.1 AraC family transcriptional regulator [Vibrio sp. JC009]
MSYYWLGEDINNIPEEIKSYITNTLDIYDCDNDFSVLTLKSVKTVFFGLSNEKRAFFDSCIKICENLDKRLITLNLDKTKPKKTQEKFILLQIDTSDKELTKELTERLKAALSSNKINNTLTIETKNKHLSTKSGSRIDIYQVISFIDDHLDKEIKEEELAKKFNYSTPYFSKIFKTVIGMSFRDYITGKRIKKAKILLRESPEEKLASIAYQCGYNDVSYFSRIFKKKTNMTPNEYRSSS